MKLAGPHATRPISYLGLWTPGAWRLKVYGIRHGGAAPDPALVEMAKAAAAPRLPTPDAERGPYGVGFLGVHQGRGADFTFLDWWSAENELHHLVWTRVGTGPLRPNPPEGPSVCVWDLAVQWREREAWVAHVLADPKGPDLESYLADARPGEA
ncbi:MAG: hypothetical protein QOE90_1579 [Thermoplasmata archaeon]|jgi:hypothetical protein|nr:hypothetical protein [Thermoplasmata archaeon]